MSRPCAAVRRCFSCGNTGPLSIFAKDAKKSGGHSYRCRDCERARCAAYRARARSTDEFRSNRARHERFVRAENDIARASRQAAEERYRQRNERKNAVHLATIRAIRGKVLVRQPCEVCGALRVDAHHDDYLKPLAVRWLCPLHHRAWHKANGEGENAHPEQVANG
jgi:hypothetical protein